MIRIFKSYFATKYIVSDFNYSQNFKNKLSF